MEQILRLLQNVQDLEDGRYKCIYIDGTQFMVRNIDGEIKFIANGKEVFSFKSE